MANLIIVGAQWGDEGKGKIVDLLTDRFRYSRPLSGRTQRRPYGHHQRQKVRSAPDPVRNPAPGKTLRHRKRRRDRSVRAQKGNWRNWRRKESSAKGRLFISNRAHVILEYHRLVEKGDEERRGQGQDRHHQSRHRSGLRRQDGAPGTAHLRSCPIRRYCVGTWKKISK